MVVPSNSAPAAIAPEVIPRALFSRRAAGVPVPMWRRGRALGAALHFEADEGRDGQRQEDQEKEEKHRVHGENGRGQHAGEGQHRQEQIVARRASAVEAHNHGEEHQVDSREQGRVERWILRVAGQ